jgi:2-oxo-4-hydroxy-4-carboxy-5-ureidoimidazoline decarboxylase
MADASAELKEEMLELNLAYQEKFGHVFLICATGRTGEQMRDAVRERIGNSPEREREIVRVELGKINRIRLGNLVHLAEDEPGAPLREGTGGPVRTGSGGPVPEEPGSPVQEEEA